MEVRKGAPVRTLLVIAALIAFAAWLVVHLANDRRIQEEERQDGRQRSAD